MLPGPDFIRACPYCSELIREFTLTSGNTFGATLWSDGKAHLPMMPEAPPLVRCRACGKPYWHAEAKRVQPPPEDEDEPPWLILPPFDPPAETYPEALAAGLGNTRGREQTLRLLWWQTANDPHREAGTEPALPDAPLRASLTRLLVLLKDAVLQANVARSLGDFDAARSLLSRGRAHSRLHPDALALLDRLAEQGSRQVVVVGGRAFEQHVRRPDRDPG